ncbi:hypothetical protein [uncultured Erythrobacter sp.]|uniref:hypothetical protein n=1 Tax=uncultured Erythrobacter sp. TaxID=263913 RepID=UPI00260A0800|nr:hypothetical protein [uncultured Erythrobacter sp.]
MNFNADFFTKNFNELQSHISSMSSGYPLNYQRVDQKTEPVIDALPHFRGSKVLEVGSNFGMYSLLMSPIAKRVTALELDQDNIEISHKFRRFFEGKGCKFENLQFYQQTARSVVDHDYDALLLTLVLYHLNNDEISILLKDAKEKASKIIIQCRPARMIKVNDGSLKSHVSKTNLYNGLCDIASNIQFLENIGMTRIKIVVNENMLGNEVFPVLISER